ncbi:thiol reductant ABC exporter subunit CydD [Cellulomonas fimi]|uniref:Thiol reductant ABC exporter subunit CydD n=1 Tax=Cellulomonas fimi TaxID=1708 RepID=A0A7Y0LWS2_CELFI|nr:thiol reductant ABC exporter subunit CydD [Cellulomonas fimi]NMR19480.1 thiol reductant ABC exporter subunit CydD [Cellulomonas fimi]
MRPLDPRLLRHARPARAYIALTAVGGLTTAVLVVAQALLIAWAVSPVVEGRAGWSEVDHLVGWLAVVVAARCVTLVVQESYAHRAARDVIADLREHVLTRAVQHGPRWLADGHGPQVVTLATRGLDDLEPYFVRYLPQLLLAATVTPAALAVVLSLDLISALIITVTLPLIPVFMWLIGVLTARVAADRLRTMQRLGAQLLDLLAGLSTLKALGREHGPAHRVGELGRAYTRTTMGTLKIAFLSGAVLEFLASISVALVAVVIGTRLVAGNLDLTTGLAVLMLAPEIYKPLREVGSQFHASANGIAAADQAFAILERPLPVRGTRPAPDLRSTDIVLHEVTVVAPGRGAHAPWRLTARLRPGAVVALVGPSGAGKTTAALVVLGLVRPDSGRVTLMPARRGDGADDDAPVPAPSDLELTEVDPGSWNAQVAWVPQRPVIVPGTVRENVLGSADTTIDHRTDAAARATGFDRVVASLPDGWDTLLGQGGVGLSVGQRQRMALTRALLGEEPLVVLDEPTAHLDATAERQVLDAVARLRADGRTVLLIAHRAAAIALADDVVTVAPQPCRSAAAGRAPRPVGAVP